MTPLTLSPDYNRRNGVTPQSLNSLGAWADTRGSGEALSEAVREVLRALREGEEVAIATVPLTDLVYVNVNEEGMTYNVTTDVHKALDLLAQYPNDSMVTVVKGSPHHKSLIKRSARA